MSTPLPGAAPPRSTAALVGCLAMAGGVTLFGGVAVWDLGLFGYFGRGVSTIDCTRDAAGGGDCTITQHQTFSSRSWRFPVAELRGADLVAEWHGGKKNPHLDGMIKLRTAKGPLFLSQDGRSDEIFAWREQATKRIDAYARARGAGTLAERDCPPPPAGLGAQLAQIVERAGALVLVLVGGLVGLGVTLAQLLTGDRRPAA